MAQRTVAGAHIKIYINGRLYNEAQELSYTVDYGEEPIYGIDSVFPQEIKVTKISIKGRIAGLRVGNSNGLQAYDIRPGIRDSIFGPYVSIRIFDNRTAEDIMYIPFAKITNEAMQVSAKGIVKTSFSFSGLQPQQPLDR